VAKVRYYKDSSGLELTEALKKAVADCVKEGILHEFLEKYGGEIVSLLRREFSMDDALEVRAEEASEERAEKIAEKMISRGTPLDIIAEDTGLSLEKVEKIAKKRLKVNDIKNSD
jgi:hypothetical protein